MAAIPGPSAAHPRRPDGGRRLRASPVRRRIRGRGPCHTGKDRELRKSGDATHLATDGPAPRRYDGDTAARVRVPVFVRSEKSDALVGDGVPGFRQARRTSTAPSVACNSLRQKPGEQLLCCSHALHSWHSPLCGCRSCDSDGLALTGPQCHLCCGLCERHCSATAGTL